MGQTQSSNTQRIITNKDLKLNQKEYDNIKQSCAGKTTSDNVVDIGIISNSSWNSQQQNEAKNLCILKSFINSERDASVINKTIADLASKQKTTGGIFAANSRNEQNIHQNIKSKVDQSTYSKVAQSCVTKMSSKNIARARIVSNSKVYIDQTNKSFNKCLFEYAKKNKMTGSVADESGAGASSEQKTIAGLGMTSIIIIAILIGIGFLIFKFGFPLRLTGNPNQDKMINMAVIGFVIFAIFYFFVYEGYADFGGSGAPNYLEGFLIDAKTRFDKKSIFKANDVENYTPDGTSINIVQPNSSLHYLNNSSSGIYDE